MKPSNANWKIGYVSSGLKQIPDICDQIDFLSDMGYDHLEIELHRCHLHPDTHSLAQSKKTARYAAQKNISLILATGEAKVLGPVDFEPSFISMDGIERFKRTDFTLKILQLANAMEISCVTLQSGCLRSRQSEEEAWYLLLKELEYLTRRAEEYGVVLALEPHPDHFVSRLNQYRVVKEQIKSNHLLLNLDVGHAECVESENLETLILQYGGELANVHVEDIKNKTHHHLPFGKGDICFSKIFEALHRVKYQGAVSAEFYGDGLDEFALCRDSFRFLKGGCDVRCVQKLVSRDNTAAAMV